MPRSTRLIIPGQPHHIVQRGNNRTSTFLDDQDVEYSLYLLRESSEKHKCAVHAYVLMTNHFHLLVTPSDSRALSKFVQSFALRYVRYFNRRYKRTGTLWEDRYFSELVDSERYYFTCARYIEMNPVRAKIVNRPEDHFASSFRRNSLGFDDALVTPHPLYQALAPTLADRAKSYTALFNCHTEPLMAIEPSSGTVKTPWRWAVEN
jgi:putative transposase